MAALFILMIMLPFTISYLWLPGTASGLSNQQLFPTMLMSLLHCMTSILARLNYHLLWIIRTYKLKVCACIYHGHLHFLEFGWLEIHWDYLQSMHFDESFQMVYPTWHWSTNSLRYTKHCNPFNWCCHQYPWHQKRWSSSLMQRA